MSSDTAQGEVPAGREPERALTENLTNSNVQPSLQTATGLAPILGMNLAIPATPQDLTVAQCTHADGEHASPCAGGGRDHAPCRIPGVAYDDAPEDAEDGEILPPIAEPTQPDDYIPMQEQQQMVADRASLPEEARERLDASMAYETAMAEYYRELDRREGLAADRAALEDLARRDAAMLQTTPQASDTPGPVQPGEMDTHCRMVAQIWAMSLLDDPGPDSASELLRELMVGFGTRPDSAVDIARDFAKLHGHAWSREGLAGSANQIAMDIVANKTKTGSRVAGAMTDIRAALTGRGNDGRPRVDIGANSSNTDIATAIAGAIAAKEGADVYAMGGAEVCVLSTDDDGALSAKPLTAVEACSVFEAYVDPGVHAKLGQWETRRMAPTLAEQILAAKAMRKGLPAIDRIANYPMPIVLPDGSIRTSVPGYDPATRTYTSMQLIPETLSLADAVATLDDLLCDFCFAADAGRDYRARSIAYLLTYHCRHLLGKERSPLIYVDGNRPAVGKDYLLGLGALVATGHQPEMLPPSGGDDETRKRILSVCRAGSPYMLVSNVRGHLVDASLEQACTSPLYTDRVLGSSRTLTLPNLAVYGLSGNNLTLSEDLVRRTLPIRLVYNGESIEDRTYRHPDLYAYALANRPRIVGALQAMVDHWIAAGMPDGTLTMASYGAWARIVGGICEACGVGNPLVGMHLEVARDDDTEHFVLLLAALHERYETNDITPSALRTAAADRELFDWVGNLYTEHKAGVILGKIVGKMVGRRFGRLHLEAVGNQHRRVYRVVED
jgi:hypothetical protein